MPQLSSTDNAATVQTAIEALTNVDAVDIEDDSSGNDQFLVTFLSNLGEVPAMTSNDGDIVVATVTDGVCG